MHIHNISRAINNNLKVCRQMSEQNLNIIMAKKGRYPNGEKAARVINRHRDTKIQYLAHKKAFKLITQSIPYLFSQIQHW